MEGVIRPSIVVVQPTVPSYRLGLFNRMAQAFGDRLTVYASTLDMGALTDRRVVPVWERKLGPFLQLVGLEWQSGALSIPIARGDVLVVSGGPRCVSNIALLIRARLNGARTLWWGHYWSSTSRNWRLAIRLILMRLSDGLLFYTDREIQEYNSGRWAPSGKVIFALNNGIETSEIAAMRVPYVAARREDRLLFIGRLTHKAEICTLVRALAEPACGRLHLDVVGSGETEAEARQLAHELGVEERIHWHGGTTDEAQIAEIANRSRLFVYPGGVGLSLIHGLAYGLPAIVHDDRWAHMPEIAALNQGRNGLTFRKGDAAALADVITAALSDLGKLDEMSAAAIATTTRSFNAEDMADRFCAAIEAMLPPPKFC